MTLLQDIACFLFSTCRIEFSSSIFVRSIVLRVYNNNNNTEMTGLFLTFAPNKTHLLFG